MKTYGLENQIGNYTGIGAINMENFKNLAFSATVAAGSKAIVLTLLGEDGNAPSATNRVSIKYISETLTSTVPVTIDSTAATTLTIPSGATLGFTANETGRFYLWAINNASTNVLGVSRTADLWPESNLVTTVAIGTGSDLATVMYSDSQLTSKACRCIGYVEALTGATPGEWPDNAIKKCVVMHNGVKRTGDIIQIVATQKNDTFTATPGTATFVDVTGLSATINLTSSLNKVLVRSKMFVSLGAGDQIYARVYRDAVLIGLGDAAGSRGRVSNATIIQQAYAYELIYEYLDTPGVVSPVYKVQLACSYYNYEICLNRTGTDTDANQFPRGSSNIIVTEIMA